MRGGIACEYVPIRLRHRPRAPPPGPVGQVGRMSETAIAFARSCSCGIETAIAFAGAKWVFLAQFSGAEVMVVSMVAVQGHAVVLSVSKSPRCRASCAKKFALHAQNTPKSAFLRLLGEFFRGNAAGGSVLGEFFAPIGPAHRSCGRRGARGWLRWGFCSIRSWLAACRRRVVPLMTPFPPFGDGPAAPSAASARAPSRWTSPRRARRRSLTTTSSRRRRNMSAALDRLKQQNEPE